jgi:hypothetical protein
MNIPYTYIIGWRSLDIWYYGCRYSLTCNPSDLWDPYKTSSSHVKNFIEKHGNPDVIRVTRTFTTRKEACNHEERALLRFGVPRNKRFLNRSRINNACSGKIGFQPGPRPIEWTEKMKATVAAKKAAGWKPARMSEETKSKLRKPKHFTPLQIENLKRRSSKNLTKMIALNTGKKRPEHSLKMKKLNEDNPLLCPTPLGDLRLSNEFFGLDFMREWCHFPDKVVTSMMIRKTKSSYVSNEWVGKTRREIGFGRPYRPI